MTRRSAPGIYIEIRPDTTDGLSGRSPRTTGSESEQRDTALTALQRRMADLYASLLEEYDRALGAVSGDSDRDHSGYPELIVPVPADEDAGIDADEELEIVFDEALYQQLFLIYTVDGWAPLAAIDRALAAKAPAPDAGPLPGGTPLDTEWSVAYRFFRSTSTILALLIREAIATLERRAVELLQPELRRYSRDYKRVWNIELQMRKATVLLSAGKGHSSPAWGYLIGDPARAEALLSELLAAVRIRDEIEELQAAECWDKQPGGSRPQLLAQAQRSLAEQLEHIRQSSPFALLAYPSLRSWSTVYDLGTYLGVALEHTGKQAEELAKALHPAEARTLRLFAPEVSAEGGGAGRTELLRFDPRGPESAVLAGAHRDYPQDPGCAPLLMERLWHLLAEVGDIPEGSFESIVHHHYTVQMVRERLVREDRATELNRGLSRAAALLALAVLTGPVGAAGFLLNAAATALDLILLGDAIYTAVADLQQASLLLAEQVGDRDALTVQGLAAVAQACSYRSEIMAKLGVNLLLTAAGYGLGKLELPKKLQLTLLGVSFAQNVITLVEP